MLEHQKPLIVHGPLDLVSAARCTVEDLAWVERRCAVCYVLSTLLGTGWFLVPTLSYMQQDAASAEAARLQRAEETAGRDRGKVKTA